MSALGIVAILLIGLLVGFLLGVFTCFFYGAYLKLKDQKEAPTPGETL